MQLSAEKRRNLPDFLVIGAAKSGTTSLFFYLAQHPEIFVPRTFKEPGYLSFAGRQPTGTNPAAPYPDMWGAFINDLAEYCELFETAQPAQKIGEATPEYLYLHDATIKNIRDTYGDRASALKFMAVLRNPVERIWSHYWMFVRDGYETLPFTDATSEETIRKRLAAGWHPGYDYRGFGQYAGQITAWQKAFGSNHLKVALVEDLHHSAENVCKEMYAHIGVDSNFTPDTSTTHNVSGKLRHERFHDLVFRKQYGLKELARAIIPEKVLQLVKQRLLTWNTEKVRMPPDIRAHFVDFYRNDIVALQDRLGRDLGHWRR